MLMNRTTKVVVLVILAMLVATGLFAATPSRAQSLTPQASSSTPSGTFIFGSPVDTSVADLNPLTTTNSLATILVTDMYATQLAFQWPSGNFSSWLASSWTITDNSNGTESIHFNLNPNADWVNGSRVVGEITSKDVAFTFNVLKADAAVDTYDVSPYILSISTPSNTSITFLMSSQNVLWFTFLATQIIIPSAWAAYDGGNIAKVANYTNMGPYGQEISAGPFVLTSVNAEGANLTANTNFWMGTPHIKTFYVEKFTSSASADLALEKGQIDAVIPALSDYDALSAFSNVKTVTQKEPYVFYLWMNDQVAPFNNVHFRQGLAYALNKTYIMSADEDNQGAAGPANMSDGGLPGVMSYAWAPGLKAYNYNVAMANLSFYEAGYHIATSGPNAGYYVNNSTGAVANFSVQEPSSVADWVASGNTIASELNSIGIKAVEEVIPIGTWVSQDLNQTNFKETTYFGYVPSFTNPYVQLDQAYYGYYNSSGTFINAGWNFENFTNSSINSILNSTASVSNSSTLITDLYKVQQIIDQQMPMVPMSNAYSFNGYNNATVRGYVANLSIDSPENMLSMSMTSSSSSSSTFPVFYIELAGIIIVVVIVAAVVGMVYLRRGKEQK